MLSPFKVGSSWAYELPELDLKKKKRKEKKKLLSGLYRPCVQGICLLLGKYVDSYRVLIMTCAREIEQERVARNKIADRRI